MKNIRCVDILISLCIVLTSVSIADAALIRTNSALDALQRWRTDVSPDGVGSDQVDVDKLEESIMSVLAKSKNSSSGKSGIDGMVKTMLKMVGTEMMPKVKEAHSLAQKSLDGLYAAFTSCGSTKKSSRMDIPALMTAKLRISKDHKLSRKEEATKSIAAKSCTDVLDADKSAKRAACKALENLKKEPNTEADKCHSSGEEEYGQWLERLGTWMDQLRSDFRQAEWDCGNATAKVKSQKATCTPLDLASGAAKAASDGLQDQLEATTCTVATKSQESCEGYALCYTTARQNLENEMDNIIKLEKSRKAEWRALQRMGCLLEIFGDGSPDEKEVDACKEKVWSTDEFNLKYSDTPDAEECESPTADPCSGSFTSDEYGELPEAAQAKECTACAGLGGQISPPADFKVRCAHDRDWSYVLDYGDDRTKDDFPGDRSAIATGFSNENAYYIGNDALEELEIEDAEMCALSSSTRLDSGVCQFSCFTLSDGNWGGGSCPLCDGLSSPLKKMIAGLSGQGTGNPIVKNAPAAVASFQGDKNDVWWSCHGHVGINSWGVGWHKNGWGLSLRADRTTGVEFGWYDGHCGWSSLDVDTFTIRVHLKPKKISIAKYSYTNFGVSNFQERCPHDRGNGWRYVLDYSDVRGTDDLPTSYTTLRDGFDNKNAYYIGNEKLNNLDIASAELCFLSSNVKLDDGSCQWSCREIKDEDWAGGRCDTCASHSLTGTKKIIAGMSGQMNSGVIVHNMNPAAGAHFQGDLKNVWWSCGGYKRIYTWGRGWHVEGWGVSMRTESWRSGREIAYYSGHCQVGGQSYESKIDVDTFQVRVKLK